MTDKQMMARYGPRSNEKAQRIEAARLLDLTHSSGERGPRTFLARKRLAVALDLGFTVRIADLAWLRRVAVLR